LPRGDEVALRGLFLVGVLFLLFLVLLDFGFELSTLRLELA